MTDIYAGSVALPRREFDKSRDYKIMTAFGLLFVALVLIAAAPAVSHEPAPMSLDLVLAYP